MPEQRIVTNRVFVLGLDELYRQAMKRHECTELLQCAEEVASVLSLAPGNVPVEGDYTESPRTDSILSIGPDTAKCPTGKGSGRF